MELRELLDALRSELDEAEVSADGASVSLAFSAKKDRDGAVDLDFIDAGSMSKPRPEELHRLELLLEAEWDDEASGDHEPESQADAEKRADRGERDGPPPVRKLHTPPALPPKRPALD